MCGISHLRWITRKIEANEWSDPNSQHLDLLDEKIINSAWNRNICIACVIEII